MTVMSSRTSCPPRFGTRRNPDRLTLGGGIGLTAKRLGFPFMPHQQLIADVVGEIDPDTGLLAYDEMGLTIPRQEGKSTWVLAKSTHRASATGFYGPRQHLVYTAQTRLKAREKWEEDFCVALAESPAFRNRQRKNLTPGQEHVRWKNGSRFGIESNTEKAGHGGTLDEAYIDEAFSQPDSRLEQAFEPAMITRQNKLLAWISTAGWLGASPYLEDKVKVGRAVAEEGRQHGLVYFEWSAPQDADPGDPDVWRSCMPAMCLDPPCRCGDGQWRHTITEDAIRRVYQKALDKGKLNDFRRAYLNQWVPKEDFGEDWQVIPEDSWTAAARPGGRM